MALKKKIKGGLNLSNCPPGKVRAFGGQCGIFRTPLGCCIDNNEVKMKKMKSMFSNIFGGKTIKKRKSRNSKKSRKMKLSKKLRNSKKSRKLRNSKKLRKGGNRGLRLSTEDCKIQCGASPDPRYANYIRIKRNPQNNELEPVPRQICKYDCVDYCKDTLGCSY